MENDTKYCPKLNPNSIATLEACRIAKLVIPCHLKGLIACCSECGYRKECKSVCPYADKVL